MRAIGASLMLALVAMGCGSTGPATRGLKPVSAAAWSCPVGFEVVYCGIGWSCLPPGTASTTCPEQPF